MLPVQEALSHLTPSGQPSSCPHCHSGDLFIEPRGPQLGLFCRQCGRFIKWLPQNRPIDTMPFGKHRGHLIVDLPDDYLNFILENVPLKGSLYRALSDEFERRGRAA